MTDGMWNPLPTSEQLLPSSSAGFAPANPAASIMDDGKQWTSALSAADGWRKVAKSPAPLLRRDRYYRLASGSVCHLVEPSSWLLLKLGDRLGADNSV